MKPHAFRMSGPRAGSSPMAPGCSTRARRSTWSSTFAPAPSAARASRRSSRRPVRTRATCPLRWWPRGLAPTACWSASSATWWRATCTRANSAERASSSPATRRCSPRCIGARSARCHPVGSGSPGAGPSASRGALAGAIAWLVAIQPARTGHGAASSVLAVFGLAGSADAVPMTFRDRGGLARERRAAVAAAGIPGRIE